MYTAVANSVSAAHITVQVLQNSAQHFLGAGLFSSKLPAVQKFTKHGLQNVQVRTVNLILNFQAWRLDRNNEWAGLHETTQKAKKQSKSNPLNDAFGANQLPKVGAKRMPILHDHFSSTSAELDSEKNEGKILPLLLFAASRHAAPIPHSHWHEPSLK